MTAWAMLALYSVVVSGVPLPMGTPPAGSSAAAKIAGKDRSRPFPCMDNACGCDTAEQCFTNCCCHTPSETLAWAKARGIEGSVINALMRRVAAPGPTAPPRTCCSAEPVEPSGCSNESDDVDSGICSDYQSLAAEPSDRPCCDAVATVPEQPSDDEPETPSRVVILRAMLACGGIVAQWAAAGTSLPPPAIVACDLPWPQVGVVALGDFHIFGTGSPPDLPPPRA
jgi:hypothetical protein